MATAQVGDKLWVSDRWIVPAVLLDPGQPDKPGRLDGEIAGPQPLSFAPAADGALTSPPFSVGFCP